MQTENKHQVFSLVGCHGWVDGSMHFAKDYDRYDECKWFVYDDGSCYHKHMWFQLLPENLLELTQLIDKPFLYTESFAALDADFFIMTSFGEKQEVLYSIHGDFTMFRLFEAKTNDSHDDRFFREFIDRYTKFKSDFDDSILFNDT